jgi:hypothetical protein
MGTGSPRSSTTRRVAAVICEFILGRKISKVGKYSNKLPQNKIFVKIKPLPTYRLVQEAGGEG